MLNNGIAPFRPFRTKIQVSLIERIEILEKTANDTTRRNESIQDIYHAQQKEFEFYFFMYDLLTLSFTAEFLQIAAAGADLIGF